MKYRFHGGCAGCTQQELHGTEFCFNCRYFDAEWGKPNLNNSTRSEADIERERIKEKFRFRKALGKGAD